MGLIIRFIMKLLVSLMCLACIFIIVMFVLLAFDAIMNIIF